MATMNFSIPDDVKEAFNKVFEGENKSAVVAGLMRRAIEDGLKRGATHVAFGDLFLEDVRAYRIKQLEGSGLEPLFPLWREPTESLARRVIDAGVEAVLTCVDPNKLSRSFAGRTFDHALLDDLPEGVDPCGENGEFHTCVLAGPMFREPLRAVIGEVVERDGFIFVDLVPGPAMVDAQKRWSHSERPSTLGRLQSKGSGSPGWRRQAAR